MNSSCEEWSHLLNCHALSCPSMCHPAESDYAAVRSEHGARILQERKPREMVHIQLTQRVIDLYLKMQEWHSPAATATQRTVLCEESSTWRGMISLLYMRKKTVSNVQWSEHMQMFQAIMCARDGCTSRLGSRKRDRIAVCQSYLDMQHIYFMFRCVRLQAREQHT